MKLFVGKVRVFDTRLLHTFIIKFEIADIV